MPRRIGIWALCGLAVALFWFLLSLSPDHMVNANSNVVALTAPVAFLGRHVSISYYWSFVINAAIYALLGLVVKMIRIPFRSKIDGLQH